MDYNLNDLVQMLEQKKRFPASEEVPVQKGQPIVIESAPLVETEEPIKAMADESGKQLAPKTDLGDYVRQNFNQEILRQRPNTENLQLEAEESAKRKAMSRGGAGKAWLMSYEKMLNPALPQYKKPDFANIRDERERTLKEIKNAKAPETEGVADYIYALGPAVLGMATGNSAGASAAKETQTQTQKLAAAAKEGSRKSRQSALEMAIKKLDGLGKLQEGEGKLAETEFKTALDTAKLKDSQINDFLKLSTDLFGKDSQESKWAQEAAERSRKSESDAIQKGIVESVKPDMAADNNAARVRSSGMGKPPTQAELQAASRFGRAQKAEQELDALGVNGMQYPALNDSLFPTKVEISSGEGITNNLLQNQIKDPKVRAAVQAEMDWGMNFLRDETGAAIAKGELPKELNKYFPRKGDDNKTVAAKASSRRQVVDGLRTQAGRAQLPNIQAPQKRDAPKQDNSFKIEKLKALFGEGKLEKSLYEKKLKELGGK